MINDKKKSCVVCHAYLFEEDDVVYCPECGAPHHRECYINLGRCGLAEAHGTENQYDKLKREEPEEEPQATSTAQSIRQKTDTIFFLITKISLTSDFVLL